MNRIAQYGEIKNIKNPFCIEMVIDVKTQLVLIKMLKDFLFITLIMIKRIVIHGI